MENNCTFEKPNRRRRTPQEKKSLAYERDHSSYPPPHEREGKKESNRAYRRKVRQVLTIIERHQDDYLADRTQPERVTRRRVGKGLVVSLRERVAYRLRHRWSRRAHNFFRHNYWAPRDRKRFAAFLEALTSASPKYTHGVVGMFNDMLDVYTRNELRSSIKQREWDVWGKHRKLWLFKFLQHEPEWRERLRAWRDSFDKA